ncbi:MAG: hypothetical protein K2X87_17575 [Gemmataceae bacterium]|nr:hypothetical protein [Gemmataceae bacterium]
MQAAFRARAMMDAQWAGAAAQQQYLRGVAGTAGALGVPLPAPRGP